MSKMVRFVLGFGIFVGILGAFWVITPNMPQVLAQGTTSGEWKASLDWDKKPPAPAIPDEVAKATTARYLEAYRLLTGKEL